MSRNVVRSISRPCVRTQWRLPTSLPPTRRWYSEAEELDDTEPTKSILDDPEEATLLLRKLDQKHLSQARKNIEEVIRMVEDAKAKVAALPTTVQILPEIPPYTLGEPRHVYQRYFPETANQTIAAAKHVREHLIDLKYKPYEDSDDTALVKEIAALSEDEKRERYKEKQNEAKAMEVRLRRQLSEDVKKVVDTIQTHLTVKGQPMPEFDTKPTADNEMDSQAFKDLAEPIATESKKSEAWSRPKRKSEVRQVDSPGWFDVEKKPIRRFMSRDTPKGEAKEQGATNVVDESPQHHGKAQEDDETAQTAESSSNEASESAAISSPGRIEGNSLQEADDGAADSESKQALHNEDKKTEESTGRKGRNIRFVRQGEKAVSPTFDGLKSQLEAKVSGNKK